ncbi:uncharacterized protein [Diadema setosum]|uniref:uncharacterized protein n=1 Tax=Diadema setosum TaxID=31175 RepID=UPI003B3A6845
MVKGLHLMRLTFQQGYHLITDNFYTKVKLAEDLLAQQTLLTGTVRMNSRGFPHELIEAKLADSKTKYMQKGHLLVMAFKDKKKKQRKPVLLLSSFCHAENHLQPRRDGQLRVNPEVVKAYNAGMGSVDLMDRKIYQISS